MSGCWSPTASRWSCRELLRRSHASSQRVLVVNGSFLLNYGLINHENRKLAGRLIDLAGSPGRVVFLESGDSDPRILPTDPAPQLPQGLAILAVWPINVVLLQLIAIGIIFGFARWPILGRPREPRPPEAANFGLHAEALGKLLSRTSSRDFALRRVAEYRKLKA